MPRVTIEPGAYVPGFGGVRIEDDVLVTNDGRELLTTVDRALRVLSGVLQIDGPAYPNR